MQPPNRALHERVAAHLRSLGFEVAHDGKFVNAMTRTAERGAELAGIIDVGGDVATMSFFEPEYREALYRTCERINTGRSKAGEPKPQPVAPSNGAAAHRDSAHSLTLRQQVTELQTENTELRAKLEAIRKVVE